MSGLLTILYSVCHERNTMLAMMINRNQKVNDLYFCTYDNFRQR